MQQQNSNHLSKRPLRSLNGGRNRADEENWEEVAEQGKGEAEGQRKAYREGRGWKKKRGDGKEGFRTRKILSNALYVSREILSYPF